MIDNWLDLAKTTGIGVGSAVLVAIVVHLVLRLASRRLAWARALLEEPHVQPSLSSLRHRS